MHLYPAVANLLRIQRHHKETWYSIFNSIQFSFLIETNWKCLFLDKMECGHFNWFDWLQRLFIYKTINFNAFKQKGKMLFYISKQIYFEHLRSDRTYLMVVIHKHDMNTNVIRGHPQKSCSKKCYISKR